MIKYCLYPIAALFLLGCTRQPDEKGNSIVAGKLPVTGTTSIKDSGVTNPALTISNTAVFNDFRTGDLVFQVTGGQFALPIQQATGSEYTHCGIVISGKNNTRIFVIEAFDKVTRTPVQEWIKRGQNGKFMVMRLKKSNLMNDATIANMRGQAKLWLNKPYDDKYGWSDDSFYCSELVYKLMASAGVTLCATRPLSSYDLNSQNVKNALYKVYGQQIPMHEMMIAPADLLHSVMLEKVFEN